MRERLQLAVIAGIGVQQQDWHVRIREWPDSANWEVEIIGPNKFFWKQTFFGPEQQDYNGEFVRRAIARAIMNSETS
jgi:hypothetical protein